MPKPTEPKYELYSSGSDHFVSTIRGFQQLEEWIASRDGVMFPELFHLEYDLQPMFLHGKFTAQELRDLTK
jgi:hypothetical protein